MPRILAKPIDVKLEEVERCIWSACGRTPDDPGQVLFLFRVDDLDSA